MLAGPTIARTTCKRAQFTRLLEADRKVQPPSYSSNTTHLRLCIVVLACRAHYRLSHGRARPNHASSSSQVRRPPHFCSTVRCPRKRPWPAYDCAAAAAVRLCTAGAKYKAVWHNGQPHSPQQEPAHPQHSIPAPRWVPCVRCLV
jgi:hypothetical protein